MLQVFRELRLDFVEQAVHHGDQFLQDRRELGLRHVLDEVADTARRGNLALQPCGP